VDQATKQGYDFFMMKEILEEPQAIRRATMQDRKLLLEMAIGILRSKQVVITACVRPDSPPLSAVPVLKAGRQVLRRDNGLRVPVLLRLR